MHSYHVKAINIHKGVIKHLSEEVGLLYNEYECCKQRHLNLLLNKMKCHKQKEKLLEIMKAFILYALPHKLGNQIEGYAKELSNYIRKKDIIESRILYSVGAYVLKDYKYDGATNDSYFIAKYKELCFRS